jgi:hypothetical protein
VDVDLKTSRIHVEQSWDDKVGPITPKSRAGRRSVPIPPMLHAFLEQQLQSVRVEKFLQSSWFCAM